MLTHSSIRDALRGFQPRTLDGATFAAVAILVSGDPHVEILLIQRAQHALDPWSGQMAFPGGRQDVADEDLLATAIREAAEEVGVNLDRGALLGRLNDVNAVNRTGATGMVIRPFVFASASRPVTAPDAREVAQVIWADGSRLYAGESATHHDVERRGIPLRLPAFDVSGNPVWGLTYAMLNELFSVVRSTL